ncbi:hypothetical protein NCLIV_045090 [Neospora caninum Liverpool]|uniref:S1/P1 nuclease n=1 Tax=Neospora caninum (strain Liverpool) TaxID=572307 RepID=F0VLE8_NEOCL|nr:hypothetical protein NCLIV_045090 [Neospora caninum Liverpool]CBZ54076.1 hypothetical protein NCLIV_045090 [Neospora caninum Liverpool]CEL68772.1 TPA: hypothetical protein BN1204_045090 [Neospora caninum Liverpool]|eukprot:XP_003884107.1 hypothetical protein NCLIV_045090 [Neospora caninum Liverpool]
MRSFAIFLAAGACALLQSPVLAWHSGPHMIVASIARSQLSALVQLKVDYILGLWRGQYPNYATMERASVWLDDINGKGPPYRQPARRFDFLQVFRFMHGVNIPYNPEGIQLQGLDAFLPIYERSAEYLLDLAWEGLKATTPTTEKLEDPFCSVPPPLSHFAAAGYLEGTVNSPDSNLLEPSIPEEIQASTSLSTSSRSQAVQDGGAPVGTLLSLNFFLRILIHLMADIHQPLHSVLAFSPAFPKGDRFGSEIPLILPDGRSTNLHAFWDGAGSVYMKHLDEYDDREIAAEAQRIMEDFPKERVQGRLTPELLAPNFRKIAEESHRFAAELAYREFNFRTFTRADLPYIPSSGYVSDVRLASRLQIAVAGYRLGAALEELSAFLPVPDFVQNGASNE